MTKRWMATAMAVIGLAAAPAIMAQGAGDEVESRTERAADRAERQSDRAAERAERKAERARDKTERKAEDAKDRTRVQGDTIGEEVTDTWITTKVKATFVGDDALKGADISVDTESKGVVTLTGTVPNEAARSHAVEAARGVKGVRSVRDQLRVAGR